MKSLIIVSTCPNDKISWVHPHSNQTKHDEYCCCLSAYVWSYVYVRHIMSGVVIAGMLGNQSRPMEFVQSQQINNPGQQVQQPNVVVSQNPGNPPQRYPPIIRHPQTMPRLAQQHPRLRFSHQQTQQPQITLNRVSITSNTYWSGDKISILCPMAHFVAFRVTGSDRALVSRLVGCGFESWPRHTKDVNNVIYGSMPGARERKESMRSRPEGLQAELGYHVTPESVLFLSVPFFCPIISFPKAVLLD